MKVAADWCSLTAAAQAGSSVAVVCEDLQWSGDELLYRAAGAADWMLRAGIAQGTPVPALLQCSGTSLALLLAGAATGRPLAPLGPRLTQRELVTCIQRLGAPVLVAQPSFADVAAEVASQAGCRVAVIEAVAGTLAPPMLPTPDPTDTALILHTSGTTGLPKAVHYRHDQLVARALLNASLIGLERGSVFVTAAPFHHIAGVGNLLVALAAGASVVAMPEFTVPNWQALGEHGVTHALAVPTMIEMLLRQGALTVPSLDSLIYGGSPIHPHTLRAAMDVLTDVNFLNLFGQTEGSPLTSLRPADHRLVAAGREDLLLSVGKPVPGVELHIAPQPPGHAPIGEILAHGAHLVTGDGEHWLHTGDLGSFDPAGYLFLAGRKGDRIIRGGENVYPLEVETALAAHPDVMEIAVAGVPDPVYGEAVKAFVVPNDPGNPPDPEGLRRYAREALAGYKVPSAWAFVPSLPRNASGKVVRRLLRD